MAVQNSLNKISLTATGGQTAFPFSFPFYDPTHIFVYKNGSSTALSNPADYTLSTVNTPNTSPGGTVTLVVPATANDVILIVRTVPNTQLTDYKNNSKVDMDVTFERDLDLDVMRASQLSETVGRSLQWPITITTSPSVTLPDPTNASNQGKAIGIAADGLSIVSMASIGTVPVPVPVLQGGTGATTAGAARTNLGAAATGLATASGITLNTSKLLGRTTAAAGAIEEISVGSGLTLSAGTLSSSAVLRSYLAGLGLSTAGSSTTMTVAAGLATDVTNVDLLTLASSIGKTTAAWAVGTGNGGLDTGAIANSTWYHFYLIKRTDTGVVDVLFSLSASAPTMPANYTEKRRIGSGKTDGVGNWTAFVQDGDYFRWLASVLDINSTNPGTAAVSATLTVPTGVNVHAIINVSLADTTGTTNWMNVSDLAANDEAGSATAAPLGVEFMFNAQPVQSVARIVERTNTSAQVRYRVSNSSGTVIVRIATLGWIDRRGKDA